MTSVSTASVLFLVSVVESSVQAQRDRDNEAAAAPFSARRPVPEADAAELGKAARLEIILRVALDRNRDEAESHARAGTRRRDPRLRTGPARRTQRSERLGPTHQHPTPRPGPVL
jgi:hypothetical protein